MLKSRKNFSGLVKKRIWLFQTGTRHSSSGYQQILEMQNVHCTAVCGQHYPNIYHDKWDFVDKDFWHNIIHIILSDK